MNFKANALLVFFGTVLSVTCLAQEIVATRDGRRVVLNADGTWNYATNAPSNIAGSALETMRAYLSAPSWRDRVSLVLYPERVKPLMECRYSGGEWRVADFQLLTQTEPTPTQVGWVKVEADVAGNTLVYYLKKTNEGYRIDWETSVGANPMSPEEFRATRPTRLVRFRVLAKLDDYYNFEFSGAQNTAYSIAMTVAGGADIGHGYVKKNDTMGQELFGKLKDGRKHKVVVDVQCLPNARDGSVFLITKVVSLDGWWIDDTVQPALTPVRPAGAGATVKRTGRQEGNTQ